MRPSWKKKPPGETFILFVLAAGMLAACGRPLAAPALSQAELMGTAIATVSTGLAGTQRAMPTETPVSLPALPLPTVSFFTTALSTPTLPPASSPLPAIPTFTPLAFTDPSIPLSERIVYYYFVNTAENPLPDGTVRGLAPSYTDQAYTSDTAADLSTALEIVLRDGRNYWRGTEVEIVEAAFGSGHAELALQGEYFAISDGVLCMASLQILFTVFANPAVQSATVTLNGGLIGNLCLFGPPSSDEYLNDAVYTRAEMETFMRENASVSP